MKLIKVLQLRTVLTLKRYMQPTPFRTKEVLTQREREKERKGGDVPHTYVSSALRDCRFEAERAKEWEDEGGSIKELPRSTKQSQMTI